MSAHGSAVCSGTACTAVIEQEPAQRCGGTTGRHQGCGRYFCDDHLRADLNSPAITQFQCDACFATGDADRFVLPHGQNMFRFAATLTTQFS